MMRSWRVGLRERARWRPRRRRARCRACPPRAAARSRSLPLVLRGCDAQRGLLRVDHLGERVAVHRKAAARAWRCRGRARRRGPVCTFIAAGCSPPARSCVYTSISLRTKLGELLGLHRRGLDAELGELLAAPPARTRSRSPPRSASAPPGRRRRRRPHAEPQRHVVVRQALLGDGRHVGQHLGARAWSTRRARSACRPSPGSSPTLTGAM